MKKLAAVLFLFISCAYSANAQQPGGQRPPGAPGGAMPTIGHVYGKLVDGSTKQPVEYASVTLHRAKDSSLVTGMLTRPNGDFSFENLPFGQFTLRVNFMGYKSLYKKVNVTPQNMDQDLGNLRLEANAKALAEVEVTGQRSAFSMGIDKKIFNVDRNLVSMGGTATDVLKSVPSVNVDIDGNVKVRNASPNLFVDGKPSTLTLDQIPADAIESVELITNPSAKYDAEGMSGILNIVLKKNRKAGINGMVNGGIGTNDKYNGGGNLNIRQGKVNFFINYNINANRNWGDGVTDRTNFPINGSDTSYSRQVSDSRNGGKFQFGRAGFDFYLDNRNTLSISQNIVGGDFRNKENLLSTFRDDAKAITGMNDRFTDGSFFFRNYTSQIGFKHLFAQPNKEWTADFNYNRSKNGRNGGFTTQQQNAAGVPVGSPLVQSNTTDGKTTFITMQTDFVNPIGEKGKFEAGAKATIRDYSSIYDVFDKDNATGDNVFNPVLSNDYKYNEQLYAVYANYAGAVKNFGYQAGLRVEQYIYAGEIPSENQKFEPNKAKPGFFPSVYLSQKMNKDRELQLNYSRRVNRPNFFQLIPYRDYSDPLNQREGNPNLKPEFTNSIEFSYAKMWGAHNFLGSLYYRNTNNLISTISEPIGTDTLLNRYVNANKNMSYGAELTGKVQVIKTWDLTANVNLFQTELNVITDKESYKNRGFAWLAKLNSETRFPWNITFQVNATYQAPAIAMPQGSGGGRGGGPGGMGMASASAQGRIKGFSGVDVAVKKDFLKNKALSVSMNLSDVFNTREYNLEQTTMFLRRTTTASASHAS
ncbi:TonB-dependent receptor [Chitinophaga sedimenti]|uniref:TonB-dependent receptor domain-containing protein n=1 Tax=Chitinophaga sedimenti TaxID=2033606 RepID=UPI002004ADFA|nr:TonB-dependent receptor [Chitinophaga sedimenti]MCK7556115.1 TonB-dependent receptor [Chitinophaga sedimenti]